MKFVILLSVFLSSTLSFAQHHGGGITNAKVAELSSHRVGRLVDTGKIPEEFVTNMQEISIVILPGNTAGQPAYEVDVKQPLNQSGSQSDVKIFFDMTGKFLSFSTILVDQTGTQLQWPDLVVTEIVEAALHFVTEETPAGIDLKPFNEALNSLNVSQRTNVDGSVSAIVVIDSSLTEKKLEIELTMAGKVIGFKTI